MLHSIPQALVTVDREVAHIEEVETGLKGEEESVPVWFVFHLNIAAVDCLSQNKNKLYNG